MMRRFHIIILYFVIFVLGFLAVSNTKFYVTMCRESVYQRDSSGNIPSGWDRYGKNETPSH